MYIFPPMTTHPTPIIRKFNPGLLQSDEGISEQFVVRHHELSLLLDDLRGNIASPSCQHILVIGPRGRGKTMLLARVAAELRSNEDFAASLLPVRFMEESQEIFSLTDFWLETMFHLANEVDEHDATLARELRDTREALAPRWREQITEAHARATVLDAADRLGKQLVLIVENLQSLFRDVHDDFGWQLREVLQTEPQIILLGSATSRFRQLDDVSEPFFEMLRIVELEPLDTDECRRLWEVVSGKRASRSEVRPLQILTGGNPRLLVMAAEFARHRSLRRLMSELVTMIDEHTEYFRGHLEALAKTERRVYIAVIDLWRPSSASEIAVRARVDIRVASTMLGRLVERGAVLRQGRGRKRLYSAAEPLYSMYYKLRRERDEAAVVENLIRFMVACYGLGDLWKFSVRLTGEAAESAALRRGIRRALLNRPPIGDCLVDRKWDAIQRASEHARTRAETRAIEELEEAVQAAAEAEDFERVIELVDEDLSSRWQETQEPPTDSYTAWTRYLKAHAHEQSGNARAVLSLSDQALAFADSRDETVQLWTALTLAMRGAAQHSLGEYLAAIDTCDDFMRRFGLWHHGRFEAVIAETLVTRGCSKGHLGDVRGAIRDYDEVVGRFDGTRDPETRASLAAALMSKALACRRLGDRLAEIRSYDAVIERFQSSDVLHLRRDVALALSRKSMAQADLGLADEALASCKRLEQVVRSWPGNEEDPSAEPWVDWLTWRVEGARSLALAVQENYRAALASFQAAYVVFLTDDQVTTRQMLELVAGLVARGVPPQDLLAVLAGDVGKSASLRPLIVALHERAGDPIRAPREVEEVAADIRDRFREAEKRVRAGPSS
ncbi:MAG: AAA family ATPase [Gemmatimonadota bacterium]|nr:AAA family ATPase [Gemmatimonadota bacterium]